MCVRAWHVGLRGCAPLIHRLTEFNEARSQSGHVSVGRSTFQSKNVKTCEKHFGFGSLLQIDMLKNACRCGAKTVSK